MSVSEWISHWLVGLDGNSWADMDESLDLVWWLGYEIGFESGRLWVHVRLDGGLESG